VEELNQPTAPLNQQESNVPVSTESATMPVPESSPALERLTRKQWGQLRRMHVTVQHGTVIACGHKAKFSKDHDPTNNCVHCWAAYFATSVDLDLIHTVLTTKGGKALVALKGTKFVRMFHGFLSSQLLPALAAEINNEEPAKIEGSIFSETKPNESSCGTLENSGVLP
jgi:hypothetical protein